MIHRKPIAALMGLALCAAISLPAPASANQIYEPDSSLEAPNSSLELPPAEVEAVVSSGGAELVKEAPQYANAVVTTRRQGGVAADVYVGTRRALRLRGDDGTLASPLAKRLNEAHERGLLRPDRIMPSRRGAHYAIMAGRETLLTVDPAMARAQGDKPAAVVLRWIDSLRGALGGVPFRVAASRGGSFVSGKLIGEASWYGPGFHGRRAANGERFDANSLTAAHRSLPFGTLLLVTNTRNGRSALVRVTDRGPYIHGRVLDVSAGAARAIGMIGSGVARVRIDILRP